jgi:hypothetical protein
MSHHSEIELRQGLTPVKSQWLYALALKCYRQGASTADPLAGRLLVQIAGTTLGNKICQPRQAVLGRMHGRHARSIQRSLTALRDAGYIQIVRRGRKISNVYRLAKWLWCRLTNRGVGGQLRLPGVGALGDDVRETIERMRRRWEAARRELAPATR